MTVVTASKVRTVALISLAFGTALLSSPATALGSPGHEGEATGGAQGKQLYASASHSNIKVTQVSGPTGGKRGGISSTDVNWKPPPCWYEPVFTPEQLKEFSETPPALGYVSPHASWGGVKLWTDHYRDRQGALNLNDDSFSTAEGYDNYNLGKDGYFWRGVAPDTADPESWACDRVMFWQNAGEIPEIANAPTPRILAEYAYDKVEVPSTEIEMKPEGTSTVNLPAWVWLDKGTFQEIKVRAELPNTGLWAETTARPVALHLAPGTDDAVTFPASGDCRINADNSIGTPYAAGKAAETPPCGFAYLRATGGTPYQLKTSITWEVTWQGSDGSRGDLPNGTFETTQDINVQEIQSVNR
ncbi:hypothetical protein ACH4TV_27350 [Streptomyces sp. NPDC020898]|uniref:hypothetical protein n=1 Tax=Streptomyces sp. NPDC020898 TaxID=3365101 RepID=UPI0037B52F11